VAAAEAAAEAFAAVAVVIAAVAVASMAAEVMAEVMASMVGPSMYAPVRAAGGIPTVSASAGGDIGPIAVA
jgi:hypothetical protein